ncbi:MAG: hypothetical protein B7X65_21585 [Polaromonas sp. 39-63-25]|nr:MAG: hypothetical protein B7Y60_21660 [Polaromonas sp. 35-63-35]OYZ15095.1 MAG: hypothetical protein B7Y28_22460 [Polaromonas sp. 16-63-31]OYZ75482.1 MAG: hypothetical protein B7Y09_23855 [Polaromonas sp. 24-63-21]OZA52991.1 MAG: hypothetical protein B7X88_03575 [Polaromonas sp. 17-63-33]OZA85451.1 MAG: hypothetical protein B7X65_21585 [Polaromonas sp. 39-63-25]
MSRTQTNKQTKRREPLSPFDLISWKVFNDIAHWVAIIALGVWGYLRTKDNDNVIAVKAVSSELVAFIKASTDVNEQQNTRLTVLEEAVKHLPTEQDMAHLANDVSSVKAQINGLAGLLARMEHQINLVHDHLLNNNKHR